MGELALGEGYLRARDTRGCPSQVGVFLGIRVLGYLSWVGDLGAPKYTYHQCIYQYNAICLIIKRPEQKGLMSKVIENDLGKE